MYKGKEEESEERCRGEEKQRQSKSKKDYTASQSWLIDSMIPTDHGLTPRRMFAPLPPFL